MNNVNHVRILCREIISINCFLFIITLVWFDSNKKKIIYVFTFIPKKSMY